MLCTSISVINKPSNREKRREDRFYVQHFVQPWISINVTLTQRKVESGGDRGQQVGFIGSKGGIQNDLQLLCSLHYTPAGTQIHSSSVLDYWLQHQMSVSSIFSSHSPTLMLSASPPIALRSQLTGPHGTASSSVSVTGRVHPARHFSAWTHPLILMENVLRTGQHNATKTWINTKNIVSFHFIFFSLWHQRLFLFKDQVEFEHGCYYAAFHFLSILSSIPMYLYAAELCRF